MNNPLLLYSTYTWLAYVISERYYQSRHYVWCSPFFDPRTHHSYNVVNPPSSSPCEIYQDLAEAVKRGDRHNAKIVANKIGIVRGASAKKEMGIITEQQYREIGSVVRLAEISDFRPSIYIIPYHLVSGIVQIVPVESRAHPLSIEYLIEELLRSNFDIIEWL